jgi:hypothetical protein
MLYHFIDDLFGNFDLVGGPPRRREPRRGPPMRREERRGELPRGPPMWQDTMIYPRHRNGLLRHRRRGLPGRRPLAWRRRWR